MGLGCVPHAMNTVRRWKKFWFHRHPLRYRLPNLRQSLFIDDNPRQFYGLPVARVLLRNRSGAFCFTLRGIVVQTLSSTWLKPCLASRGAPPATSLTGEIGSSSITCQWHECLRLCPWVCFAEREGKCQEGKYHCLLRLAERLNG